MPTIDRSRLLYETHVDVVFAYLARRVGRELASDLTADTFRIAIERLDGYHAALGSERSWLFGIATNLLRRHWRTEQRRFRALSREWHRGRVVDEDVLRVVERTDASADVDRLLQAVAELDGDDRDLLVLLAWEGCSHQEIAEIMRIPPGTVRSRLFRIRTTLRAALARSDEENDHG